MTTIGGSRRSSALRSTKRVCGSGPSDASTSSITPSTIDSVRSTSPPKSAWPGVSTMLIRRSLVVDGRVLRENRDAALALELGVVHRALGDPLVGAERAALMQQRIDERRLAVVDVGDDGDVAPERVGDVGAAGRRRRLFCGQGHPFSIEDNSNGSALSVCLFSNTNAAAAAIISNT